MVDFYARAQRAYDAREAPLEVETEHDGEMVPCGRCGKTGVDPLSARYPGEDDACRDCSGDGWVACLGCAECTGSADDTVFVDLDEVA